MRYDSSVPLNGSFATVRVAIGIAVSAACLAIAFRNADLAALGESLKKANYWWLLAYPVLAIVLNLIRGEVWRILLKRQCRLLPAFWAYCVGFLFNNVLPLRIGEAARIVMLARQERIPAVEVAVTAGLERILDLAAVLVVLACTLPVVGIGVGAARYGALLAIAVVLTCLLGIYVLGRWEGWFETQVVRVAAMAGPGASVWVVRLWRRLAEGLSRLLQPSIGLPAFGGILMVWSVTILAQWTVLRAFQPQASLLEAAFMVVVVSLAIAVPAAPGFVGVYQWAGQQALAGAFPDVYTPASGLAIALTAHAVSYLLGTVLGVLGLWYFGASFNLLGTRLRGAPTMLGEDSRVG